MNLFKKFLRPASLALAVLSSSMTGCLSKENTDPDTAFRQLTLSMFRQEAASNTINLHYTLRTPSEYGILNPPVTYGTFSTDTVSAMAALENSQALLRSFPYNSLSRENRLTFDILNDYLRISKKGAKYMKYEEPLGPVTGIQAQLPVLLAEYQFYSTDDVDTYLALLEKTPEYFDSLIDFEVEKSENGLFMSDEIADSVLEQCRSFLSMGEDNYLYAAFSERLETLHLSADVHDRYIKQNHHVIENHLLPAYRKLTTALSELRGNGLPISGVCSLPDGKNYYEYAAERETGSSRTIPELKKLIQKQMADDARAMGKLLSGSDTPVSASLELSLNDKSPDAFLADLERKSAAAFPAPPDVKTTIKYVPKAMESYLSPAFYLTPCIDHTSENVIYINRSHNMEALHLYTTLAHEGYPGHLYQTVYYAGRRTNPLRSLLNYGGYVEGWATYAEMCSYSFAPLDKKQAALAQKNSSLILGMYAFADIGIHYDNWTLQDTISYFAKYGIDDTKAVTEIYRLIVSDPANYLKYYIGYVEFLELKKEVIEKTGDTFSQKKFHKAVLDVGPAPFDILRKYVLEAVTES